ncbi:MAG: hypothetical protein ACR2HJ_05415 [Fimbriimonadales bacterium]
MAHPDMLDNSATLALNYVREAAREIDGLPLPRPLPVDLLFQERELRARIAKLGDQYYRAGSANSATFILGAKKQYSFRTHARLTLASQIAYELMAREFALCARSEWSGSCYSFRFDESIPKRLYPEKKPNDRQRWKKFDEQRLKLVRRIGLHEKDGLSGLTADVSRYFDNVRQPKLLGELKRWFPAMEARINDFGRLLRAVMGEKDGLPAGPQTSFFFGDLLLIDADKSASARCEHTMRWVDEYWWFDNYPSKVEAAYRETLGAIGELGLVFNDSKSKHLDRNHELSAWEDFKLVRETFYKDLGSATTSTKCSFICGLIFERASAGTPQTSLDKFLLNRLRELFALDNVGASETQKLVLRSFVQSYRRSKDALGQWCDILLMLPDRAAVFDAAYDAFQHGKYPLDVDKARLLDMMCVPELAASYERQIPSAKLEEMARSSANCPTLRGSALRTLYSRTRDMGPALELARNGGGPRLFREYIAAVGVLGPSTACKEVIHALQTTQIDDEEGIVLAAYDRLTPSEDGAAGLRLLPADPFILTQQLRLAVSQRY